MKKLIQKAEAKLGIDLDGDGHVGKPKPQGQQGGYQGGAGGTSGYPPQGAPTGGYPPQGAPTGGYPPQGAPTGGYPPQGAPTGGYPPQGAATGYPPQGAPTGYPPQGSGYPPQGAPQAGAYPGAPSQGHAHAAGIGAGVGAVAGAGIAMGGMYAYQQHQNQQNQQNPNDPQQGAQVNWQHMAAAGVVGAAAGGAMGYFVGGKFFGHVKHSVRRDYVIIVDKSGSMTARDGHQTRWDSARRAVELLAPKVAQFDPDGISLYLFSNHHQRFDNVRDAHQVMGIFNGNRPNGSTNLAGVLEAALNESIGKRKPATLLVITDGEPNCKQSVKRVIESAANRIQNDADLSITFVQVGDDAGATRFLKELDSMLQCRFDIVDTVKDEEIKKMGFEGLVNASIND